MAYKTFANGFPLPASDLNNYLMNQSVIVFADSTARSAALPTPTEGMITYLEDTNLVEVYNGSAWTDINDNTAAIPKSTVTTAGDLIVADGASSVTRLGVGGAGQLLTSDGSNVTWDDAPASGIPATILDAAGDLIYATGADTAARLARGTTGQLLTATGSTIAWADPAAVGNSWTSISSGSIPTGSNAVTFSGLGGYNNYMLFIYGAESDSASAAQMSIRPNGSTSGANGAYIEGENDGNPTRTQYTTNSRINIGSRAAYGNQHAFFKFLDAGSTSPTNFSGVGGSGGTGGDPNNHTTWQGYHTKNNLALTTIDVYVGGNFTAGNYEIWGS
jgi:hypothetical protein